MNNLNIIGLIDLESTLFLRESPTVGYLSFLCGFVVVVVFFYILYFGCQCSFLVSMNREVLNVRLQLVLIETALCLCRLLDSSQ